MSHPDNPAEILGPPTRHMLDLERIKKQYEAYLELRDVFTPKAPETKSKYQYQDTGSTDSLTIHRVGKAAK